jgi:hypothetical protein
VQLVVLVAVQVERAQTITQRLAVQVQHRKDLLAVVGNMFQVLGHQVVAVAVLVQSVAQQ